MTSKTPTQTLTQLLDDLRTRQVRDLAYACFGENLVEHLKGTDARQFSVCLSPNIATRLRELDAKPEPLLAFIKQVKSTRLGLYFETLWRYYWQCIEPAPLLDHNLQVASGGRTLGAFDFILNDPSRPLHIEAAFKLYLGHGEDLTDPAHWIGPNANDCLGHKLDHLRSHQLPLSNTTEGKQTLTSMGVNAKAIERRFLLKGYLFVPLNAYGDRQSRFSAHGNLPNGVGRTAVRGYWLTLNQYREEHFKVVNSSGYVIIPRNHWIAPAFHDRRVRPLSAEQLGRALLHQVGGQKRPKLVARVSLQQDVWCEQERFFVVPDHWPTTARPSRKI